MEYPWLGIGQAELIMDIIARICMAILEAIPFTKAHKFRFQRKLHAAGYTRSQVRRIARARFHKGA